MGITANRYSAVWSNSGFGHLVVYFWPFDFYLIGHPVSAVWARLLRTSWLVCSAHRAFNSSVVVPKAMQLTARCSSKFYDRPTSGGGGPLGRIRRAKLIKPGGPNLKNKRDESKGGI